MIEEVDLNDAPETAPEAAPVQEAPAWTPDDETEARAFGWKPSTEWQGEKPPGLVESPVEWMERVKRSKTFSAMDERLKAQEAQASEVARKTAALNDMALRRQREDFERQLAQITASQRQAVTAQDTEAFDRLEAQKVQLVRTQSPQEAPPEDPAVSAYKAANDWAKNPALWNEAIQAVNIGLSSGMQFQGAQDQIAFAEASLKLKYPHLFQAKDTPKPRPVAVDGGGLASKAPTNGFAALPADARAAFDRYVKEGLYAATEAGRKQFMEDYGNA